MRNIWLYHRLRAVVAMPNQYDCELVSEDFEYVGFSGLQISEADSVRWQVMWVLVSVSAR